MKVLNLTCVQNIDEYDGVKGQELYCDTDDVKVSYSVYNLNECPEDAILGRELFTAEDFIKALALGMQLAKNGYTDIAVKYVEE